MFGINPTPIDLVFYLGRIPVRVLPSFWVVAGIYYWRPDDLRLTVIFMLCMFVSILIHELGHALTSEAFGWPTQILLYHFGGLAIFQRYYGNTPFRSILVALAGPFAGFGLAAVVFAASIGLRAAEVKGDEDGLMWFAINVLLFINIAWGVLNLLPVLPLDGGQVMRSILEWFRVRSSDYRAAQFSLVIGGLAALGFLSLGIQFTGILFLFLAMQNYMTMRQIRY